MYINEMFESCEKKKWSNKKKTIWVLILISHVRCGAGLRQETKLVVKSMIMIMMFMVMGDGDCDCDGDNNVMCVFHSSRRLVARVIIVLNAASLILNALFD